MSLSLHSAGAPAEPAATEALALVRTISRPDTKTLQTVLALLTPQMNDALSGILCAAGVPDLVSENLAAAKRGEQSDGLDPQLICEFVFALAEAARASERDTVHSILRMSRLLERVPNHRHTSVPETKCPFRVLSAPSAHTAEGGADPASAPDLETPADTSPSTAASEAESRAVAQSAPSTLPSPQGATEHPKQAHVTSRLVRERDIKSMIDAISTARAPEEILHCVGALAEATFPKDGTLLNRASSQLIKALRDFNNHREASRAALSFLRQHALPRLQSAVSAQLMTFFAIVERFPDDAELMAIVIPLIADTLPPAANPPQRASREKMAPALLAVISAHFGRNNTTFQALCALYAVVSSMSPEELSALTGIEPVLTRVFLAASQLSEPAVVQAVCILDMVFPHLVRQQTRGWPLLEAATRAAFMYPTSDGVWELLIYTPINLLDPVYDIRENEAVFDTIPFILKGLMHPEVSMEIKTGIIEVLNDLFHDRGWVDEAIFYREYDLFLESFFKSVAPLERDGDNFGILRSLFTAFISIVLDFEDVAQQEKIALAVLRHFPQLLIMRPAISASVISPVTFLKAFVYLFVQCKLDPKPLVDSLTKGPLKELPLEMICMIGNASPDIVDESFLSDLCFLIEYDASQTICQSLVSTPQIAHASATKVLTTLKQESVACTVDSLKLLVHMCSISDEARATVAAEGAHLFKRMADFVGKEKRIEEQAKPLLSELQTLVKEVKPAASATPEALIKRLEANSENLAELSSTLADILATITTLRLRSWEHIQIFVNPLFETLLHVFHMDRLPSDTRPVMILTLDCLKRVGEMGFIRSSLPMPRVRLIKKMLERYKADVDALARIAALMMNLCRTLEAGPTQTLHSHGVISALLDSLQAFPDHDMLQDYGLQVIVSYISGIRGQNQSVPTDKEGWLFYRITVDALKRFPSVLSIAETTLTGLHYFLVDDGFENDFFAQGLLPLILDTVKMHAEKGYNVRTCGMRAVANIARNHSQELLQLDAHIIAVDCWKRHFKDVDAVKPAIAILSRFMDALPGPKTFVKPDLLPLLVKTLDTYIDEPLAAGQASLLTGHLLSNYGEEAVDLFIKLRSLPLFLRCLDMWIKEDNAMFGLSLIFKAICLSEKHREHLQSSPTCAKIVAFLVSERYNYNVSTMARILEFLILYLETGGSIASLKVRKVEFLKFLNDMLKKGHPQLAGVAERLKAKAYP